MLFVFPLGPESEDLEDASEDFPWLTVVLIGVCVLVHVLLVAHLDGKDEFLLFLRWGYMNDHPFGLGLFSYVYLHSGWGHLLGNAAFMVGFSVAVERLLGRGRLFLVWTVSGLGAAWFFGLFAKEITLAGYTFYPPLVGASGAISGLMGCLLPARPHLRIRMVLGLGRFWKVVPVPAWMICVGYLLKEVFNAGLFSGGGVAYTAHIGGMLAGGIFAYFLPWLGERMDDARHAWGQRRAAGVVLHPRAGQAAKVALRPAAPVAAPAPPEEELADAPAPPSAELFRESEDGAGDLPEVGPPIPEASVAEMELMVARPEVDPAAMGAVAADPLPAAGERSWAGSLWEADLQERVRRARKLERRPDKVKIAFEFYQKLLGDKQVPTGYRAYAGARMARMLARGGQYAAARKLAVKLLKNPLPQELRQHIKQSGAYADRKLRAAG